MLQKYNVNVAGVGTIPVTAYSLKDALEILQAYIDKHSLD
jgi:hypothetical protein